jgi:hypothetical protein
MNHRKVAPQAEWIDSDLNPPTSGARVLALTLGGVLVPVDWSSANAADFVAWCPFPKIPKPIKDKLFKKFSKEQGNVSAEKAAQ